MGWYGSGMELALWRGRTEGFMAKLPSDAEPSWIYSVPRVLRCCDVISLNSWKGGTAKLGWTYLQKLLLQLLHPQPIWILSLKLLDSTSASSLASLSMSPMINLQQTERIRSRNKFKFRRTIGDDEQWKSTYGMLTSRITVHRKSFWSRCQLLLKSATSLSASSQVNLATSLPSLA